MFNQFEVYSFLWVSILDHLFLWCFTQSFSSSEGGSSEVAISYFSLEYRNNFMDPKSNLLNFLSAFLYQKSLKLTFPSDYNMTRWGTVIKEPELICWSDFFFKKIPTLYAERKWSQISRKENLLWIKIHLYISPY